MNLVLIGNKHCGKSTIGAAVAARWGCDFYDVDRMIEANHACATSQLLTVRQILSTLGEEYFRKVEALVVCELYLKLNRPDSTAVVALGGRTALNASITELLRRIGTLVYLRVPDEVLLERVRRAGLPPFLSEQDPGGDFLSLCRERDPQYRALAHLTLEIGALDVNAATDLLLGELNRVRQPV